MSTNKKNISKIIWCNDIHFISCIKLQNKMQNETGIIGISNGIPKLLADFKLMRRYHREHVIKTTIHFSLILIYTLIVSIL